MFGDQLGIDVHLLCFTDKEIECRLIAWRENLVRVVEDGQIVAGSFFAAGLTPDFTVELIETVGKQVLLAVTQLIEAERRILVICACCAPSKVIRSSGAGY